MSPIILNTKQAITNYAIQAKYKERLSKLKPMKIEQIQQDVISLSERGQQLSSSANVKKDTATEKVSKTPIVYTRIVQRAENG